MIFFTLIACESGINCGTAQEHGIYPTPWIQEIKLPDHYSEIPNNSLFLDHRGNLFLGKDNGLTILTGERSSHLHLDGPVFITGNGSDTLYYACENDLGILLEDPQGQFAIRSVRDRITRIYRDYIPSQLIHDGDGILMNADKGIYHFRRDRIEVFPFQGQETRLYQLEDGIYLSVTGEGIRKWTGSGFVKWEAGDYPAQTGGALICYVEDLQGYSFAGCLSDREVIAVSPLLGIVVLDQKDGRTRVIGRSGGLPDRDVVQIFEGDGDELWILGRYSLHLINHPSSLNILELDPRSVGRIFTSVTTRTQMVLGTSQGVFVAGPINGGSECWKVSSISEGIPGAIHLLYQAGNTVFAAGASHLLAIRDDKAEVLSKGSFTGLYALHEDLLFASGDRGLIRFDWKVSAWEETLIDPSLASSHSFVAFGKDLFFISGNRVLRLKENTEGVTPVPFRREELLLRLVSLKSELFLITDIQDYRFEQGEETFLPVPGAQNSKILSVSDIIVSDEAGGYWMVRHQGKYESQVIHTSDSSLFKADENSYPVLQSLGEVVDLEVRDSVLYITGMDKVSMFDLTAIHPERARIPLRIQTIDLSDQVRSAGFRISGLEFQSSPEPEFRYRLDPGRTDWSEWDSRRTITFERLKPGPYSLVVQARDLYGRQSTPCTLSFTIRAPFSLSWYAYVIYSLVLLVLLFLIQKWRLLGYQRAESRISQRMQTKLDNLVREKEKSDKLVAEILPERTVAQIKSEGKARWDKYERATVLFSDIQGFTKIAEEMNPEALIDELDKFFFHFDSVVEKYNIEKIKTIGDAYMAAGGIPEKNSTNPVEVVLAALEMQSYMQHLKSSKTDIWDLRIGIHTGPVIAGVVGHKKVTYDIWGDTVNTASRMESSGMPGKVNISGTTYGLVKDYFICEYRGKLPVKYKGNIAMYFVNGLRPELSVDLKGIPNKRFFTKLQLLRLGDLEEKVFETILPDLPPNLHFHNREYARKVYNQSFLLCRAEELEQEERLLVRTAALLLFTGLTQSFFNFENRSSVITREILPLFHYSESQIDQICNLIMATKQPFHPNNLLERILVDAKMEYIGRPDYTTQIKLHFKEMVEAGSNINGQQFKNQQLELLYGFEFCTVAAKRLREVSGADQIARLEMERWI